MRKVAIIAAIVFALSGVASAEESKPSKKDKDRFSLYTGCMRISHYPWVSKPGGKFITASERQESMNEKETMFLSSVLRKKLRKANLLVESISDIDHATFLHVDIYSSGARLGNVVNFSLKLQKPLYDKLTGGVEFITTYSSGFRMNKQGNIEIFSNGSFFPVQISSNENFGENVLYHIDMFIREYLRVNKTDCQRLGRGYSG